MNAPTTVTALDRIATMLRESMFKDIASALPQDVSPEKFIGVLMVNIEPKISEAVVKDATTEASFRRAVTSAASDGLLLDGREAVLSPANKNFGTRDNPEWHVVVNYMPMASGLVQLMFRAGISIRSNVVYENDKFNYQLGDDERIEHIPADGNRGKLTKTYAIAKVTGYPDPFREVMSRADIEPIMRASKTVKKDSNGNVLKNEDGSPRMSGPWLAFESEMWRKSVIRRIIKRLPRTANMALLDRALKADDAFYNLDKPDGAAGGETAPAAAPVGEGRPGGLSKVAAAAPAQETAPTPKPSPVAAAPATPAQAAPTSAVAPAPSSQPAQAAPTTGGHNQAPASDETWEDPF